VQLNSGKLLVELAGDEPRYVPATDSSEIKVKQVLDCLRTAEESDVMLSKSKVETPIKTLLKQLSDSQETTLAGLSLRDLGVGKFNGE